MHTHCELTQSTFKLGNRHLSHKLIIHGFVLPKLQEVKQTIQGNKKYNKIKPKTQSPETQSTHDSEIKQQEVFCYDNYKKWSEEGHRTVNKKSWLF